MVTNTIASVRITSYMNSKIPHNYQVVICIHILQNYSGIGIEVVNFCPGAVREYKHLSQS